MFDLKSRLARKNRVSVLCVGAHSDDIEIGCGGTLLKLVKQYGNAIEIIWVVLSARSIRRKEAIHGARRFLQHVRRKQIIVKSFPDGIFPYSGKQIKRFFETLKRTYEPDMILTHYRDDLHQDHRLVSELTWNTFRDHLILEYEIPKYDGDFGSPNLFVHLDIETCRKKIRTIIDCFRTQSGKQWFSEDTFLSVMRIRGIESNAPEKYAEAFYCRKMVV
ncbi:putative LmbE-like protein [Nitrospira sp. KM1]|uniref:PIG-L deacetylase family protein n=1 Tax=Nitrospira sp. KM1 TaxID=1936990 RepID=UPI0013A7A142|nr:PIG-L deacetylase family protein [Nitrospira sp. KM1]BCA53696.1 putative LmbE-like protein [Nitrospira sp. KM1]